MIHPDRLYRPLDVLEAQQAWGANCGPAALAAALERPVMSLFEAVSDPPPPDELPGIAARRFRGLIGILQMRAVLASLGVPITWSWTGPSVATLERAEPKGPLLLCVQWGGPWSDTPGAAVHRHWVTMRLIPSPWIYDVNAGSGPAPGGWRPLVSWHTWVVPRLIPQHGDGTWRIQWCAELGVRE